MSEGSYFPDYFSIEDIMVTQEKVPCVTVVPFSLTGKSRCSGAYSNILNFFLIFLYLRLNNYYNCGHSFYSSLMFL